MSFLLLEITTPQLRLRTSQRRATASVGVRPNSHLPLYIEVAFQPFLTPSGALALQSNTLNNCSNSSPHASMSSSRDGTYTRAGRPGHDGFGRIHPCAFPALGKSCLFQLFCQFVLHCPNQTRSS